MNGPVDIEKFRAYDYSLNWVYTEKRLAVDDETIDYTHRSKEPDERENTIYFDTSNLF